MTEQRQLISKIIQTAPGHLTAEEIFLRAKREASGIAMGTVYRNLKLMETAGEIRRLSVPDGPDRFDRTASMHGHLICSRCGRLKDVPAPGLLPYLQELSGETVSAYDLTMRYICQDCLNNQSI